MTFRAASYDAIDEGIYPAVVAGIEEGENDFGAFRKWSFLVETPDGERTVTAMTSGASGPRSKAYSWASVLLGRKPGDQDEELAGLPCQVHLTVNEDGYNRVGTLLPPAKQQPESTINLDRLNEKVFAEPVKVPF